MRGGWGAGCNLQAEEKSGVGASRCWVCWTEPGVGLDKVITTALSPEHFVQLWVRHVRLVLGFCPQGCSSPTLQTTSVAGLSHRVIWQLLQLLLRVQPWLLAQPGPVGLQASSFSPLNLLPVGAWSFPATSFLSSFPLFLPPLCLTRVDLLLPAGHHSVLLSAPSQLQEPMCLAGWLLPALALPDPSIIPLLIQVQQPRCAPCHQEEYDGDHERKVEAAEDAHQEPSADG